MTLAGQAGARVVACLRSVPMACAMVNHVPARASFLEITDYDPARIGVLTCSSRAKWPSGGRS